MQNLALREAIRAEATDRTWSQGVTLARDGRVTVRRNTGDEIECDVRVPGRPTPFDAILNVKHGEWECSCESREAACSHVVAAVLAAEQGIPARPQTTVRYVLSPAIGGIAVERQLVTGDSAKPLTGSLIKANAATIEADLLADQVLLARAGAVNGERLDRLLGVLADARDVRWGEEPVTTNAEPVLPRAVVEDARGGVTVRIEPDPIVRELAAPGVVRTIDNQLRPIGAVDLTGAKLEKLPQIFDVPRSGFGELIGKTLPQLAQRILVEVRAQSLPKIGQREQPRMSFEVEQDGDRLLVFPTLVYGDPVRARVDAGRLVHVSGALPVRDEDAERRLIHRLRDELNLVPGRRVELTGREAFLMQNGLAAWLRDDAKAVNAEKAVTLDAKIVIDGKKLDVTLTGSDGRTASVGAALRAWQAGVDLVPLTGGG